jgi:hypothetical protein
LHKITTARKPFDCAGHIRRSWRIVVREYRDSMTRHGIKTHRSLDSGRPTRVLDHADAVNPAIEEAVRDHRRSGRLHRFLAGNELFNGIGAHQSACQE